MLKTLAWPQYRRPFPYKLCLSYHMFPKTPKSLKKKLFSYTLYIVEMCSGYTEVRSLEKTSSAVTDLLLFLLLLLLLILHLVLLRTYTHLYTYSLFYITSVVHLFALTPLTIIHQFLSLLILGIKTFGWLRSNTPTTTYSIILYGNITLDPCFFNLRPFFQEHNEDVKQGFGVCKYYPIILS